LAPPPTHAKEIARFVMTTTRVVWLFNPHSRGLYLVWR
jgi:hypothetical protein